MKRISKVLIAALLFNILVSSSISAAHHSSTSSHHSEYGHDYYYCNGHSAHLHSNGICPYASVSKSKTMSKYYGTAAVKKVQKKLLCLGYKCGKADGIYDAKTKNAIKAFQKKKGLAVNGKINKTLAKKLKISI